MQHTPTVNSTSRIHVRQCRMDCLDTTALWMQGELHYVWCGSSKPDEKPNQNTCIDVCTIKQAHKGDKEQMEDRRKNCPGPLVQNLLDLRRLTSGSH